MLSEIDHFANPPLRQMIAKAVIPEGSPEREVKLMLDFLTESHHGGPRLGVAEYQYLREWITSRLPSPEVQREDVLPDVFYEPDDDWYRPETEGNDEE